MTNSATVREHGIALVFLTKGRVAIIDAIDAERILAFSWQYHVDGYAIRKRLRSDGPGPGMIRMHSEILHVPMGMEPDHKNRSGIDNRRSNLRLATRSQNAANRKLHANNTSGYRGVYWLPKDRKWAASISVDGRQRIIGRFQEKEDAAQCYDDAALMAFGEFAQLNFPGKHIKDAA